MRDYSNKKKIEFRYISQRKLHCNGNSPGKVQAIEICYTTHFVDQLTTSVFALKILPKENARGEIAD